MRALGHGRIIAAGTSAMLPHPDAARVEEGQGTGKGADGWMEGETIRPDSRILAPPSDPVHRHEDCGPRERLWLPKERGAEASAARHPYCVACGTVKSLALPRARPLGYYLGGLANLKGYLEHAREAPKLAQVQSHLIATRLAARPEFADPYGTPGQAQLEAYVNVVRCIRPDIDEETLLRLLPKRRSRTPSRPVAGPS